MLIENRIGRDQVVRLSAIPWPQDTAVVGSNVFQRLTKLFGRLLVVPRPTLEITQNLKRLSHVVYEVVGRRHVVVPMRYDAQRRTVALERFVQLAFGLQVRSAP